MMNEHQTGGDELAEEKSKSERKREMSALQELGRKLTELKEAQLAGFPLTEDLRLALEEYRRIRKNEAKRRQLQYIGKLMRNADHEGIAAVFERMATGDRRRIRQEKLAESWRDALLAGDAKQVTDFLDQYPATDRQEFRNLVRNAVQERKNNKPPTQARKLFRFVREVIAAERQ